MGKNEITIKCVDCPYYVESNNGYEYCSYFCCDIDRVIILSMCKWIEQDDNNKNKDDGNTDKL